MDPNINIELKTWTSKLQRLLLRTQDLSQSTRWRRVAQYTVIEDLKLQQTIIICEELKNFHQDFIKILKRSHKYFRNHSKEIFFLIRTVLYKLMNRWQYLLFVWKGLIDIKTQIVLTLFIIATDFSIDNCGFLMDIVKTA